MKKFLLDIDAEPREALLSHLLGESGVEEAAFAFCTIGEDTGALVLSVAELRLLDRGDFAAQYADYLQLGDGTRQALIKHAHATGTALAEFHSHLGDWPARFSLSDRMGLRETVPHMQWRLKNRPYLAAVVTRSGYDALIWPPGAADPKKLSGIRSADVCYMPTNLSYQDWSEHE